MTIDDIETMQQLVELLKVPTYPMRVAGTSSVRCRCVKCRRIEILHPIIIDPPVNMRVAGWRETGGGYG